MNLSSIPLTPGVEGIKFQYDKEIFLKIVDIVTRAMANGKVTSLTPEFRELEQYIKDRIGLDVTFSIFDNLMYNAYVSVSLIGDNMSIFPDAKGVQSTIEVARMFRGISEKFISASIDFEKVRVTGAFQKIKFTMGLTFGQGKYERKDPEDVAATIAHEIGHCWSLCAWLKRTVPMNHILYDTTMAFIQAEDKEEKLMILRKAEKDSKITINNKEYLAEKGDPNLLPAVILSGQPIDNRSATGSYLYDLRSNEALADQFVTKIGGGLALAKSFDKDNAQYYPESKYSSFRHMVGQILNIFTGIVGTAILAIGTLGLGPLLLIYLFIYDVVSANSPFFNRIYDRPKERMQRVRNDLVNSLKDRTIDSVYKKQLIAEIAMVDKFLSTVQDRLSFYESLVLFLSSNWQRQISELKQQQQLELLSSNSLYVAGTRFDNLI